MDIKTLFLNSQLFLNVYMFQSEGFEIKRKDTWYAVEEVFGWP